MAAASPIVLNSSSPTSFQIPSVTPPRAQQSFRDPVSSSPGLASPSTFVKPRTSGLKSGSPAQAAPDGVQIGFASAGSLWKLNELEHEKQRSLEREGKAVEALKSIEEPKASSGKLVKPKKTVRKPKDGERIHKKQRLDEFASLDPDEPKTTVAKAIVRPKAKKDVAKNLLPLPAPVGNPTISIAEYELEKPAKTKSLESSAQAVNQKSKKPRKRAAKADDGSGEAPTKKPRKRRKKSESIILNSDDPEPNDEAVTTSGYFTKSRAKPTSTEQAEYDSRPTSNAYQAKNRPDPVELPNLVNLTDPEPHQREAQKGHVGSVILEHSTHFSNAATKDHHTYAAVSKESPARAQRPREESRNVTSPVITIIAPSLRRVWTPVKDSVDRDAAQPRPHTADSETASEPKRQLPDILAGFGYVSNEPEPPAHERTITSEAVTKRRRIELGASIGVGAGSRNEESASVPVAPKPTKQKKERKKAQTITALATAAFKPQKENTADEGSMSHFFSPGSEATTNETPVAEQPEPKSAKPRKPRKPKEKPSADGQGATTRQKKPAKPKKTKVKFDEANYRSKLYSPDRATAQLKGQDFLFGTSSQLAVGEPASFIRDMQVAVQQSELYPGPKVDNALSSSQIQFSQAQRSPQGRSCIRVPTAPHGTCLSIEQAKRELWCVSSRDFDGRILKFEDTLNMEPNETAGEDSANGLLPSLDDVSEHTTDQPVETHPNPLPKSIVVDLCDTSPIAAPPCIVATVENAQCAVLREREISMKEVPTFTQTTDPAVVTYDDWMLINTSSPPPAAQVSGCAGISAMVCAPPGLTESNLLSPRRFRPPLSPLNPNTTMLLHWSPGMTITSGQIRPLSSTAADQARKSKSPSGRGPGRPRKESAVESFSPSPPKRRGRPPKLKTLASELSHLPKPKKQKAATSASQPTEASGWIDIDDIYDSDSPATPSPPRRRASSSPTAVQPLTLSPSGSPSIKAKAPAIAALSAPALKSKDTNWASVRGDLFSCITAVVKSAPRCNDASKPSWWEKILLYDPIVLEDLTAWLNEQGLRIEVKKQKAKAKKRGRKRKDAEPEVDEVEWEVHKEPLQAWMVQKWCEEKSICCLWKEGLRGGVRTRY